MAVDHFSLLFRRYTDDTAIQLAVDIVSLAILLPVAVTALTQVYDFVIPIVILWSYVSSYARDDWSGEDISNASHTFISFPHRFRLALRVDLIFPAK